MKITDALQRLRADFSGRIGVWAQRVGGDEQIGVEAAATFPAASTIKLPILYTVYAAAATGDLDLDDGLLVTAGNQVPGSGVLKDLTPGLQLSVRDLCTLMITVSDNTATNLLLDRIGVPAVNAATAALGLRRTHLYRKLFQGSGPLAESSPADLGRLLLSLAQAALLTPAACAEMLGLLRRQQAKDSLTRYLPDYEYAAEERGESAVTVASKDGWDGGIRNAVGLVRGPGAAFVVAIMSADCRDTREHPDHEGAVTLARVARLLYDHFRAGRPDEGKKRAPGQGRTPS